MVLQYDDFFNWLKGSHWEPVDISIKDQWEVPTYAPTLDYMGLELLVGKKLVVGDAPSKARMRDEPVEFRGEELNLEVGVELMAFWLNVFEIPSGRKARDGAILPLVAEVDFIPTQCITIRYHTPAFKYLTRIN